MDFSLLADRKAPWHGYQAYIGTDNYRSPEHMTRGAIPSTASDIFTSGLILYELLVGVHPYWQEDQAEYAKRVRAYDIKPPALLGSDAAAGGQRGGQRDPPPLSVSRPGGAANRAGDSRGAERTRAEDRHSAGVGGHCDRHLRRDRQLAVPAERVRSAALHPRRSRERS